jgi:hypothetical protein
MTTLSTFRLLVALLAFVLGACRSAPLGCETGCDLPRPERPPPLCADLCRAWCAPVDGEHASRRGTPYVHAFHLEPAFLGRDLLLHLEREGDEYELEAELEWALTRRLLLVAELPFAWTDEAEGLGDVGLGLRGLLVETDRLILSAQGAVELPTAKEGLGADEVVLAPSLLAWTDLGSRLTGQAGAGLSWGTESGDTTLEWGVSLAKSFCFRPLFASWCSPNARAHEEHGHHDEHEHASWLTLFLEGRGEYPVSGAEAGTSTHELLLGASVPVTEGLDVRVGWSLLWPEGGDADSGWVVGLTVHL